LFTCLPLYLTTMKILVLGLGNILLQDEGLGCRVIERLQSEYIFPAEVTVLDGGTLGLDLLGLIEDSARVIIIDALRSNLAPGALMRLCNQDIPAFLGPKMSPHQIGLQDLLGLAMLRGKFPDEVILLGAQLAQLEPGLELSPALSAQVEPLCARVVDELARWDVRVVKK